MFATVTVPLTAPGIGAGAALAFLTCMKELPATLLLRPTGMDTLATELWTATSVAAFAAAAPYAALLVALAAVPDVAARPPDRPARSGCVVSLMSATVWRSRTVRSARSTGSTWRSRPGR